MRFAARKIRRLGKAFAMAIGVGIGIGIGLLIAPASGEQTRADIADRVTDFSDKVREDVGKKPPSATGTHVAGWSETQLVRLSGRHHIWLIKPGIL